METQSRKVIWVSSTPELEAVYHLLKAQAAVEKKTVSDYMADVLAERGEQIKKKGAK